MRHIIFGESHGSAIGVTLDGVPAGIALDFDRIAFEMARRAPGKDPWSTARREPDTVKILSGMWEGKTTGTPLCAMIENTDTRASDYQPELLRPSHGDYAGWVRYAGCSDPRGGGHFSGRLTAPLVFAGAVAKQILALRGIVVGAHILQIGSVCEQSFLQLQPDSAALDAVSKKAFPTCDDASGTQMQQEIAAARQAGDSVGGVVECVVLGMPAGFGAPDFGENAEGIVAQQLFAIPAVKGVAFGAGYDLAAMRGSQANDPLVWNGTAIQTKTNYAGGVNGGITNGMPLVFSAAFRPTPSIALPQQTVNRATHEAVTLQIHGRHDPCVVHRAVPVVEAAAALAMCELLGI